MSLTENCRERKQFEHRRPAEVANKPDCIIQKSKISISMLMHYRFMQAYTYILSNVEREIVLFLEMFVGIQGLHRSIHGFREFEWLFFKIQN